MADQHTTIITDADDQFIARVSRDGPPEMAQRNAATITLAPELVAFVRRIAWSHFVPCHLCGRTPDHHPDCLIGEARRLLACLDGGQT